MNTEAILTYLRDETVTACVQISIKENQNFSTEKANKFFNETYMDRFQAIINEARSDAKQADFFNGLDNGRIDSLVKTSMQISLKHGCAMYAKDIFNHSKIDE